MKYLIISIVILCCGVQFTYSQTGPTPGEMVALKIADKMRDSLGLTDAIRDSIYQINIRLHTQKMDARRRFTVREDIGNAIQQVENTRDSLYRRVLSEDKYLLYRQKKFNLVKVN